MKTQTQQPIILSSPEVDNSQLLLDATILIKAFKHPFVKDFLESLRDKHNCVLYTIPEVVFEVAHGATKTMDEYKTANSLCDNMGVAILNIDRQTGRRQKRELQQFTYDYSRLAPRASCTDYKLCLAAFKFPVFKLISGNTKDIPQELFNPLGAIVTNINHTISTDIIYELQSSQIALL